VRSVAALDERFDVLILGGGVLGVALARTLARSGVRTALVERDDYGAAATHNSLKTVHGGLRYLQHADIPRILESVRAQRAWRSAAPHIVRPLRFTMPTTGWATRSPLALGVAVGAYEILARNRNQGVAYRDRLPPARLSRRRSFRAEYPQAVVDGLNGCVSWFDAQIRDSGRLVTECVEDARQAGAVLLNHVEARTLLVAAGRVEGALVCDRLTGAEIEVRAAVTVGALGAWGESFPSDSTETPRNIKTPSWTRNLNVVLKRPLVRGGAVGIVAPDTNRAERTKVYFVTPWHDVAIIGTVHEPFSGDPDDLSADESVVGALLDGVGRGLLGTPIGLEEVAYVHLGVTPAEESGRGAKRGVMIDFERHGLSGYLQVAANKYTTAPTLARSIAAALLTRLGRGGSALACFADPLPGATGYDGSAAEVDPEVGAAIWERSWIAAVYGARGRRVLELADGDPEAAAAPDPVRRLFRARVIMGVREEQAQRLSDALFRCTDLAERGRLTAADVRWCASWMAKELGWSPDRLRAEIDTSMRRLRRHASGGFTAPWSWRCMTETNE